MKVRHFSYSDTGGAARSALRLHQGLIGCGVDSRFLVAERKRQVQNLARFQPSLNVAARARRWLRAAHLRRQACQVAGSLAPEYEAFSLARSRFAGELAHCLPDVDVVNLHWVAGLVDYPKLLPHLTRRVPMVWTLHDMNPFTGGCHYDTGCNRYLEQCGQCPALQSQVEVDLSRRVWMDKQEALGELPLDKVAIVCPSRWLAREAKASALLGRFEVVCIPYGLDLVEFAPLDKSFARELLNLPVEGEVILFVADRIDNRRKGIQLLVEALEQIKTPRPPNLLVVGESGDALETRLPVYRTGLIADDRVLRAAYAAADITVIPSLQDNLPNIVLESLACGTPIVGFETGGVPDMVRPGETGWLCPVGEVGELARTIERALSDRDARMRMGAGCRAVAEAEYGSERQARRYLDLYEELLAR